MASSLEQLLQPGERILYHPRVSWLCDGTVPYVFANMFCIAVLALAGLVTFDQAGVVALASVVLSFLAVVLWSYPRNVPSDTMVTDRRLVQRCGLFNSRIIEVPAANVKHVAAHVDGLRIMSWDGRAVEIRHPNTSVGLGIALAYAADAPHPRLPPRYELHIDNFWVTCVVFTAISLGIISLKWLFLSFGAAIFSFSLVLGVGVFFLGGVLVNVVSIYLGGLLCLALTRPFLRYDEIRHWIDNSPQFWSDLYDGKDIFSLQYIHFRFAKQLYLQPSSDSEQQS